MPKVSTEPADLPASYAAGVRLGYRDLPEQVKDWIADQLAAPINQVIDRRGGFSPGAAATVHAEDGSGLFIKAVTDAINVDSLQIYRNERDRGVRLPRRFGILKPTGSIELIVNDQQWIVITFPLLGGTPPQHPWSAADALRCLDLASRLASELTPSPWPEDPDETRSMISFLSGWQKVAADETDPWHSAVGDRLEDLVKAEQEMLTALPGDTLSHYDLRADNIMITEQEEVWFVDWAHARNTASWFDALVLIADIISSGADLADGGEIDVAALLETHPACSAAPWQTKITFLSSLAATLHAGSRRPSAPGLPTIRSWQGLTAERILRFVRRVS
ncbi:MAG TPA: phosphotransferase [Microlunatus sp.]